MGIDRPQDVDDDVEWTESPDYAGAVTAARAELEAAVPAAAEAAIAWAAAAAAGVATAANQGTIEVVLRSHEAFVEDSFTALINALGFPPAAALPAEPEA